MSLFEIETSAFCTASPDELYALVSDLPESGRWSPECIGGQWISGEPGQVGARFRGNNNRATDVVAWAPVVRGGWQTESEIVAAEAPKQFSWSILNRSGELQESVWSYFVDAAEGGSILRHHYRMGRPTEGITEIMSHLDEEGKERFVREWGDKLRVDMQATVDAISRITEEASITQKAGVSQ
ncbi:polyketide cyclase/dehydrase and lipid transport [Mycolicibacterium phlei]|uniref:SRPBCC family protein n=1 Tax=Mycobacteroides chelonae TaxID=1774 RepID=UPI000618A97C|nr:SRPBCC family protein [Mycobacteroides chelonae]VEG14425.1 polyketide cyclase/dehydrase and lipid transport [Mycolicibacterium phlei]AKC37478.1 polyketide cyclase [Mycobacteroides chelonae]ANA96531.1 polyketide cyclase [Mycobacteroides chelonae CCUG 47445]OLT81333.1 polyketide cyclase [Mycobacteroides chelonae]ORV17365.1 polyketide cyclase [Mycobacteroides chelonae]